MIQTLLVFLWLISGWGSMIFWWLKAYDLTTSDLMTIFVTGLFGPASFILGWVVFSKHNKKTILIRKNQK